MKIIYSKTTENRKRKEKKKKRKEKKRKEKKRKDKVKPSATQIFRSDSPPTWFPLLGSFVFIGFLSWALIPMHSVIDFKVDWPKLLFKSRPQLPCRDIIHVATSISRHDINLSLYSLQLVALDVATSISCRDISASLLQPSNGCS